LVAHDWHGLQMPRSGIVQDNPDNVYRTIPVDGAAAYEILGKVKPKPPAQESFVVHTTISGDTNSGVREHQEEAASVSLDRIPVAADGSFRITVDSSPADGRPNHLQVPADEHHAYVLVRDTLADWSSQTPVQLQVRRVSGPPPRPAPTREELARRAAELVSRSGAYWLAWEHRVFFSRPANAFTLDFARVTGWGHLKCGHFAMGDDQALVLTLERRDAAYLAVQAADLWGPSVNYVDRNGSLNQGQARPDADGAYTYVLSTKDPGVHNWVDTGGLTSGTFCARWQNLPANTSLSGAVRRLEVVKLEDLKTALPPGVARISPKQRPTQLAARAVAYRRRLTE
jgi:hypothetical protein